MDEEVILRIETGLASKSIAELRAEVKAYKAEVEGATIGSEEWKEATEGLASAQDRLKDATSMENRGVTALNGSYDSLVIEMAKLKREYHAVATEAERAAIAPRIAAINDELKAMDANVGVFGRYVGNYQSAFHGLAEGTDALKKGLDLSKGSMEGLHGAFEGFSKSPALATFGIIVGVVAKLVEKLKENDDAMAAIRKAMQSLKPVMDFFAGVLDKIIDYLAGVIEKSIAFLGSSGVFSKVVNGLVGVGNAIVKYVAAPFKGVIEAIKVFKEQGIKGLGDAAKAFGAEMRSGVAFKANFKAGETLATAISEGAKSRKKDVEDAGAEIGKDFGAKVAEEATKEIDRLLEMLANADKIYDARLKARAEFNAETERLNADYMADVEATLDGITTAQVESWERQKDIDDLKKASTQEVLDVLFASADATSALFGAIADLYEADEESAEKHAEQIKGLRIASATIDTISGALSAFMQCQKSFPQPYGAIIGAIQAATVTATGIKEIAAIRATPTKGASTSATPSAPVVSAPTITLPDVQATHNITTANDETSINELLKTQRVELVYDDVDKAARRVKVVNDETTF